MMRENCIYVHLEFVLYQILLLFIREQPGELGYNLFHWEIDTLQGGRILVTFHSMKGDGIRDSSILDDL